MRCRVPCHARSCSGRRETEIIGVEESREETFCDMRFQNAKLAANLVVLSCINAHASRHNASDLMRLSARGTPTSIAFSTSTSPQTYQKVATRRKRTRAGPDLRVSVWSCGGLSDARVIREGPTIADVCIALTSHKPINPFYGMAPTTGRVSGIPPRRPLLRLTG